MTQQHTVISMDSALRAIGRTVVNFQRLEHNLKLAARLGPVQGTLSKINRDVEKRIERAATLTLGQSIQAWLSATEAQPAAASYTPDLFDATMQMTFSLGADAESRSAHAATLESLLKTRNNLIHGGLVRFPWDSPEECAKLVEELDKVNEVIRSQMEFFSSILSSITAIRPENVEVALVGHPGQTVLVANGSSDA